VARKTNKMMTDEKVMIFSSGHIFVYRMKQRSFFIAMVIQLVYILNFIFVLQSQVEKLTSSQSIYVAIKMMIFVDLC